MNAYLKVFVESPDHKLRIFPSVNNISWIQARILEKLNELFEEHYLDCSANLPSDFFLYKVVQGMLCTNVEYVEFFNDGKNQTYNDMVLSGLISGGISVRVQLVNESIIMTFGNDPLDVSADGPLVVYIQAVKSDMDVPKLLPDMDAVTNNLHLAAAFFSTGLVEIDPAVHVYDYSDMVVEKKRTPHYVQLLNAMGIDPLKFLANGKQAKETWEKIEAIYSAQLADTGMTPPSFDMCRNKEGFWELEMHDDDCIVNSITISEIELLVHFHPNGYAINRFIALQRSAAQVTVPSQLSK